MKPSWADSSQCIHFHSTLFIPPIAITLPYHHTVLTVSQYHVSRNVLSALRLINSSIPKQNYEDNCYIRLWNLWEKKPYDHVLFNYSFSMPTTEHGP